MKIDLEPGQTYIVAVSGGVDSIVLLDMLTKSCTDCRLVVAHFDHGIRSNSSTDADFVKGVAARYGLEFVSGRADLGASASEAAARAARYGFLRSEAAARAAALITAHHLDDFLETVVLNFHRGCKRRGLVSLRSTDRLIRPLLRTPKSELVAYAEENRLAWLEDATNLDSRYLRNLVRRDIMPKFTPEQRAALVGICDELATANRQLDDFLSRYLKYQSFRRSGRVFSRAWFNSLTHAMAAEVVATWLATAQAGDYTQKRINYIVVKLKTLSGGKTVVVDSEKSIRLTKRSLRLEFAPAA